LSALIGALSGIRLAMPTLLRRIEKSEIDEAASEAFHDRVDCACCLAQSNRLIASLGERSRRILAEEGASSSVIHDPRIEETVYFWE
jgi:hypothetical protein